VITVTKPTGEQCEENAKIDMGFGGLFGFAFFHPQWGGYTGHGILIPLGGPGSCFDVYVWHDGEFPLDSPKLYHYCASIQLRDMADFADRVAAMNSQTEPSK